MKKIEALLFEETKKETLVTLACLDTMPQPGDHITCNGKVYDVLKVELANADDAATEPWVFVKFIRQANQSQVPPTENAKRKTDAIPNTQSSAYLPDASLSLDERIDHYFGLAIRLHDEAAKDEQMSITFEQMCFTLRRSSLIKGKLIGEYLNRAKELVKEKGDKWLPVLRKKFGKERNGQNFMEIARRWGELETELEKNPNLSIDGALQFFRKKDKWPWPKPDEYMKKHEEVFDEAKKILGQKWPIWSPADIDILHPDFKWGLGELYDDFATEMGSLMHWFKWRVRRPKRPKKTFAVDRFRKAVKGFFTDEELRPKADDDFDFD